MEKKNVFVTGTTGFVGAGVAVHYLQQGHTVFALCRGGDPTRVERALASLDPTERWRNGTLHVVPGDVTMDDIGLTKTWYDRLKGAIDFIVHSAGHIKFEDEDPLNMEINYLGSQRVAHMARDLGWGRFVHISTAYVCGSSTGWIEEKMVSSGHGVHNGYELSKIEGEHAVSALLGDSVTIVRPSIVVGSLGAGWDGSVPVTFAGYYGYFKGFAWLKRQMKSDGGHLDLEGMRIPGDPEAEINLIPIDNLVEMIAALADDPRSGGGVFHATHPEGPRYEPLVRHSFEAMGITGGRIVLSNSPEASDELSPTETLIKAAVRPFLGYVGEQRRFRTDEMGRFYDMEKVPRIGPDEVRRLLEPALKCRFKPVDRR
ncbi:SDR family oxidoreductase [Candidatus Uhrbacteria bacterium]|nr:SDR family oxidoreductase [Candidatus Uhrbacteria bacterium]